VVPIDLESEETSIVPGLLHSAGYISTAGSLLLVLHCRCSVTIIVQSSFSPVPLKLFCRSIVHACGGYTYGEYTYGGYAYEGYAYGSLPGQTAEPGF
jgi:hypothetical protein